MKRAAQMAGIAMATTHLGTSDITEERGIVRQMHERTKLRNQAQRWEVQSQICFRVVHEALTERVHGEERGEHPDQQRPCCRRRWFHAPGPIFYSVPSKYF